MKILLAENTHPAALAMLKECGEVIVLKEFTPDQLAQALLQVEAVIVRAKAQLTGEMLRANSHLRCIAKAGVGLDNIDIETAAALGIPVVSAGGMNANAVAEHNLLLGLAVWRTLLWMDAQVRRGAWWEVRTPTLVEAADKAVGIVGLGRIGRRFAELAGALRMRVLAYDPAPVERTEGIEFVTFDELLQTADWVSVHVPLTPRTRHLLGAREFALMKRGAILTNTSRGEVVDENALAEALRGGRLRGAGLDVLAKEPPPADSILLSLGNVIVTPHSAALTEDCFRSVALYVAERVIQILEGQTDGLGGESGTSLLRIDGRRKLLDITTQGRP
jgi:D-3-phosphoglycerate dehydrogenase